jgi:hypothetical protein
MDNYYLQKEISNSDLTEIKKHFYGSFIHGSEDNLRFGVLVDALLTERTKIDFLNRKIDDFQYSVEEFTLAEKMEQAFLKDIFCKSLFQVCVGQKVCTGKLNITFEEEKFALQARCKYDLWASKLNWGIDIKTTQAKTDKQFIAACYTFDWHRQSAFYMDLSGADKHVLIGISKKNLQIFKVFITKERDMYIKGREQYFDLAHLLYNLTQKVKTY